MAPVKRSEEGNGQRQRVCMRERLGVESGSASTSTDRLPERLARRGGAGEASAVGSRERQLVLCAVGI